MAEDITYISRTSAPMTWAAVFGSKSNYTLVLRLWHNLCYNPSDPTRGISEPWYTALARFILKECFVVDGLAVEHEEGIRLSTPTPNIRFSVESPEDFRKMYFATADSAPALAANTSDKDLIDSACLSIRKVPIKGCRAYTKRILDAISTVNELDYDESCETSMELIFLVRIDNNESSHGGK